MISVAGCSKTQTPTELAAVPIVEKNVAARGGLQAWRAVESMSMSGLMDAGKARDPMKLAMALQKPRAAARAEAREAALQGGKAETDPGKLVQLPFVLELKRPRKMRLEVQFNGQTAVQVFDGENGWKLRPFLGRREVERYTAAEQQAASQQQDLDGLLIDYAAKGTKVELEGNEPVEGRDAYKLKLMLKDGQVRRVWVDAQTFLDIKIDGSRSVHGKLKTMATYLRDYKSVDGLMIPFVLETIAEGAKRSDKIAIEHVTLNPKLAESRFTKIE
jgi:outer membrane lipoprotein-sorting protein